MNDYTNCVVLTGTSGSGKSAISDSIARMRLGVRCFAFDSNEFPPPEVEGFDDNWQRERTCEWVENLEHLRCAGPVLVEGRTRIAMLREALAPHPRLHAKIILIDCRDEIRNLRLSWAANNLAIAEMSRWARLLRDEANSHQIQILDTSDCSIADAAQSIVDQL